MRFMMLMMPAGYGSAAPGVMPDAECVKRMMKYNEDLQRAGVLLALDGLHPPSVGARVSFAGGKPTVTDGPFSESKEVVGGYWMIQVRSREEAIAWAKRCPAGDHETIEIRQVQEMAEFPPDVQEAAEGVRGNAGEGRRGVIGEKVIHSSARLRRREWTALLRGVWDVRLHPLASRG